jgi:hypothetical protein
MFSRVKHYQYSFFFWGIFGYLTDSLWESEELQNYQYSKKIQTR